MDHRASSYGYQVRPGRNVIRGTKGPQRSGFLATGRRCRPRSPPGSRSRSTAARLTPLLTPPAAGKPYGITAGTTRTSWESWLLTACPDQIVRITLSQGHSEIIALHYYINLAFKAVEREAIVDEVIRWCRRSPAPHLCVRFSSLKRDGLPALERVACNSIPKVTGGSTGEDSRGVATRDEKTLHAEIKKRKYSSFHLLL